MKTNIFLLRQFDEVLELLNELFPEDDTIDGRNKIRNQIIEAIEGIDARLSIHEEEEETLNNIVDQYITPLKDILQYKFVGIQSEDPFINNYIASIEIGMRRLSKTGVPDSLMKSYTELQDIYAQRIQIIKEKRAEQLKELEDMEAAQEQLERERLPKETSEAEKISDI